MSNPKSPASRRPAPIPLSTDSLEHLSDTLFTPNLKPPRLVNPPTAPLLAGSKLAPPWAELDERPAWRVRRFKLWRDNAPGLRLAVLDPRRRGHLKRYQSFALPAGEAPTYGVRAIPVLLNPKPDPARPTPRRPLVMPRTPYPWNPGGKIPKWDRKARYQRLLQYKYVLDQEHERRFRAGMRMLMEALYSFERENMREYDKWGDGPWNQEVDAAEATYLTQFFRDIKKKSTNIFHHLQRAHIPIDPVWRREEVHRAVKAEQKRRDKQREIKEAKKAAEEAKKAEAKKAEAKKEEAEIAHAEAELFFQLVRAGVTEEDRAGELDELQSIWARVAKTAEYDELAGELDELDDVRARLQKTTEQIAALRFELARLEVQDEGQAHVCGETGTIGVNNGHEAGTADEIVKPKKKRHRSKHKKPAAGPPPDPPSDGGLTDASTVSAASVRTPTDVASRPPLRAAKSRGEPSARSPRSPACVAPPVGPATAPAESAVSVRTSKVSPSPSRSIRSGKAHLSPPDAGERAADYRAGNGTHFDNSSRGTWDNSKARSDSDAVMQSMRSTLGSVIIAPRPKRRHVSRLVDLDTARLSPPPSPALRATLPPAGEEAGTISVTRSAVASSRSGSPDHSGSGSSAAPSDLQLLDIRLALDEVIPEPSTELSRSAMSQQGDVSTESVDDQAASNLRETSLASDTSLIYADLNRDVDTAAIFASSAPRSDISRLVITTTDDDDDSASDDSSVTIGGAPVVCWTRGSDAASEPDTELTASPARPLRAPVYTS